MVRLPSRVGVCVLIWLGCGVLPVRAQEPEIENIAPAPALPPSEWVLRDDTTLVDQVLAPAWAPLTLTGSASRLLVDRRWVLSPPYSIEATVRLLSPTATAGLLIGLTPQVEDSQAGTAWFVSADGSAAVERRRRGEPAVRLSTAPASLSNASATLSISVRETTVSFALDGVEVLNAPAADVDVVGTPAVWIVGGDAQIDSLTITTLSSSVQ